MGQKWSKFWGSGAGKGIQGFGQGVLKAVPGALMGGLAGSAMGPGGAVMGALSGLVPGVAGGIQNAVTASKNPAGPQSWADAAGEFGKNTLDIARDAVQSPIFAQNVERGTGVMADAINRMAGGQLPRQALIGAGAQPWLTGMARSAQQGAIEKLNGATGTSTQAALIMGNPMFRAGLAQAGKGSTHRYTMQHAIQDTTASLAQSALGHLHKQLGFGGRNSGSNLKAIMGGNDPSLGPASQAAQEAEGGGGGGGGGDAAGNLQQDQIPAGGTSVGISPGGVLSSAGGFA